MPLVGYMKTSDAGRISSITNFDGDKQRRKKIQPIAIFSADMYVTVYVVDCYRHVPPGAVVPVLLKRFLKGGGWEELGIARCCPLCWKIIEPPVGIDMPKPQPIVIEQRTGKDGGSRLRVKKPKPRVESLSPTSHQATLQILKMIDETGSTTVQDVMAFTKLSRASCLKYLGWLIKSGKITKHQSAGGRGVRSSYTKAP